MSWPWPESPGYRGDRLLEQLGAERATKQCDTIIAGCLDNVRRHQTNRPKRDQQQRRADFWIAVRERISVHVPG